MRGIVEIKLRKMGRHTYNVKAAAALHHHSDRNQNEPENQEARRHHIGENADIGRWMAGENVNQNQKDNVGEGDGGQRQTDQADRILNELL